MQVLAKKMIGISRRAYPTRHSAEDYVRIYVQEHGIARLLDLLSEESTITFVLADAKVVAAILALGTHGATAIEFQDLLRVSAVGCL